MTSVSDRFGRETEPDFLQAHATRDKLTKLLASDESLSKKKTDFIHLLGRQMKQSAILPYFIPAGKSLPKAVGGSDVALELGDLEAQAFFQIFSEDRLPRRGHAKLYEPMQFDCNAVTIRIGSANYTLIFNLGRNYLKVF
jgi:hypothetical protein